MLPLLCAAGPTTAPMSGPATRPAPLNDKFLRYVPDDHGGATLQASVVTYQNAAGQSVDLVAAVHVADGAFYKSLNESFKSYDSLLYELIKPKDMNIAELHDPDRPTGWITMLQQFLKNTLKLQFQLEAVNYDAPNFVHADLDAETFYQMEDQRGESITGLMIQSMLQEMMDPANDDPTGGMGPLLLALSNPDKARGLKMMLGQQFGRMDDMLAGMEGPNGSVLLTERNKACMKVLADRLAHGDKKIGIFYGAGHLRGMEKIMTTQMGFKQVGDPKWRIAWDMTGPPSTQP
jgi:hypothetical protein